MRAEQGLTTRLCKAHGKLLSGRDTVDNQDQSDGEWSLQQCHSGERKLSKAALGQEGNCCINQGVSTEAAFENC